MIQYLNKIDFKNLDQCAKSLGSVNKQIYNYLGSYKTEWIRLAGFPVGMISISLGALGHLAMIVEAVFKGFANLFSAPFSNKPCERLEIALIQLISSPFLALAFTYQYLIVYRIAVLMNTFGFLTNPHKIIKEIITPRPVHNPEANPRPFNKYFDLASTNQCEEIIYRYVKAPIYGFLKNRHTFVIRLGAPFVGIISCAITAVARILAVVEPIFKGILNILGFPFFDQCEIIRGVEQITITTLTRVFMLVPMIVLIEPATRIIMNLGELIFTNKPNENAKRAEKYFNATAIQEELLRVSTARDNQKKINARAAAANLPINNYHYRPHFFDSYKWL